MEHVNPYEPPLESSPIAGDGAPTSVGTITSQFLFTSDYMIEALSRHRSQHAGRRIWRWFRYVVAVLFLYIAILGLSVQQYFGAAFTVAFTVFMFFPHKIDDVLA